MSQFGFTRNKDSVVLRPKLDKQNQRPPSNKRPLLALENLVSAAGIYSSIYGMLIIESNVMSNSNYQAATVRWTTKKAF